MKEKICKCIAESLEISKESEVLKLIEVPPNESMGDFAFPCFGFAKTLHRNPQLIAAGLKKALDEKKEELAIDQLQVVGGYLNIFMNRERYVEYLIHRLNANEFELEKPGRGKTFCIDYSSPNIAKNFHVGHLRTTIIGHSLSKIFEKLGYRVIRLNYLGDWGTQFGKLIVAYKTWSSKALVEEKGIEELLRIYVKFNTESEKDPQLMDEARNWFVKMEQKDEEAIQIWSWFKEISLLEFDRVYELLGVSFDSYEGESFYQDKVISLLEELREKHLLKESQGANIIDLSEYDMPPCLITKRDGGTIYHSRDIAAALHRKETYHFEQCLYVTGLEQSLHFKQVFKAIEVMGYDWADKLIHVPYGLVRLEGEKLSSRNGNIVYAEDILTEAVDRAETFIQIKNPDLLHQKETAKKVGVGAIIFHELFNQRIKNVDFSWKEILNFDGTTGPYVQYTYARAKSILKKSNACVRKEPIEYHVLTDEKSYELIKTLSSFKEAVEKAAILYEPSVLAKYVADVAASFNRFYHDCPILQADEKTKRGRLYLTDLTQSIIADTCSLLGFTCPEEM